MRTLWHVVFALMVLGGLLAGHYTRALRVQAEDLQPADIAQEREFLPLVVNPMDKVENPQEAGEEEVVIAVDLAAPEMVSAMSVGATHTQYSLDLWGEGAAVARGQALLADAVTFQNQHIMGWGATNPMPAPNTYNWTTLDSRVATMRATGATMVLTLCCAPGWMRPEGYQADWEHLEVAPDPAHLQDYVDLTVAVAQRYPDVRYFQVWNEFKGMWGTSPGCTPGVCGQERWDYERYTTLYNAIYAAIKAVRPDALIGGPYVVFSTYGTPKHYTGTLAGPYGYVDQRALDAVSYWLANKQGADFIAIDASSGNKDGVWLTDEFSQAQKFADVIGWLRQQPHGGATLPIHWAEWYASVRQADGNVARYNAIVANALIVTLQAGTTVPLLWQPQGDAHGLAHPLALFTDTRLTDGGQATPLYDTLHAFKEHFPAGTQLYRVTVSKPNEVVALASATKMLLVNKSSDELDVLINDASLVLEPYAVRVIDTPSHQ